MRCIVILILGLFASRAADALPELTEARAILELAPEVADSQRPARLKGVVTCVDEHYGIWFVQDATAGIFVHAQSGFPQIGDLIEIEGKTGKGLFSPILQAARVTPLGQAPLPEPKPMAVEQLASGRYDAQWVEVEGIVIREYVYWSHPTLTLISGASRMDVIILKADPKSPPGLVDARVKIRGVAASTYNDRRQVTGYHLFAQSTNFIAVLEPPPADPFAVELRLSRKMMTYSRQGASDHRMRLRGVVTHYWPNQDFYIHDADGGVRIQSRASEPLEPADLIEVVGFPTPGAVRPVLREAIYRKIGREEEPSPLEITAAVGLSGEQDSEVVSIEGKLLQPAETHAGYTALVIEADQKVFRARYRSEWKLDIDPLLVGGRVRVTGICARDNPETASSETFSIWMRRPADFKVIAPPSVYLQRQLFIALGGLCGAILIGGAWVALLRIRVRQRTDAIRARELALEERCGDIAARKQAEEALRLSERQLRASLEERERLGRDLHDGIIQTIYAAGLNIDDCARIVKNDPSSVERRLRKAVADLNRVIRDVRDFIMGLERHQLKGDEFKAALKSLALSLDESQPTRIELDIDERASTALNTRQATQLLHIAREALSNAVRHARAQKVTFQLRKKDDSSVIFEVCDDGQGFNPEAREGNGYGLRNMAARAGEINAAFKLLSQNGEGTRIVLDIPCQSFEESASENSLAHR
jgi:signal transduction histidine kinase